MRENLALTNRGHVETYAPEICAQALYRRSVGAKNVTIWHICARHMRLHVHLMSVIIALPQRDMRPKSMRLMPQKHTGDFFGLKFTREFWRQAI